MSLGVLFAHVLDGQLLRGHLLLVLQSLIVILGKFQHVGHGRLIETTVFFVVSQGQAIHPGLLVEIEEHLLFQFVFPIVDADGVVVSVEAVDEGLHGGLLQVAKVGGGLAGLLAQHHHVGVDEAEGVDHHLALHRLDGVHHHGYGTLRQRFEGLLCVDVYAG